MKIHIFWEHMTIDQRFESEDMLQVIETVDRSGRIVHMNILISSVLHYGRDQNAAS